MLSSGSEENLIKSLTEELSYLREAVREKDITISQRDKTINHLLLLINALADEDNNTDKE